jgi:O-antigen/teichoic acid export membrane protein
VPLILYMANSFYQESIQLAWLAVGILMFSSIGFVMRFALLGISNAKIILVSDIAGTIIKFVSAFILVTLGYGALGILFSFFLQVVAIIGGTIFSVKRSLGFRVGDFRFSKQILIDGLVNLPSKLSGTVIISLGIILLAYYGTDSSKVGILYIAMMISIVAGSFASSLAYMSIPASSRSKVDVFSGSLRIGLAFTAPLVTLLVLAPETILSIIGKEYISAANILMVLAVGVLPSVIISNAMSKFNSQDRPRRLLVIGSIRIISFLAGFFILVPQFGTLGVAYSILASFLSSAALSIIWSPKGSKYIAISAGAVLTGILVGKVAEVIVGSSLFITMISMSSTFIVILIMKCTSVKEIKMLIKIAK